MEQPEIPQVNSEVPSTERVGLWTQFRMKTQDWSILHWAAALGIVSTAANLLSRLRGKR